MTIIKQLVGHTSPETAYVVDDYPYGFKLRTSIRYWVETKSTFGQRLCSQTVNPKNGKYNKPKCSTYSPVEVLGLDEKGYVKGEALSYYDDYPVWEDFAAKYQLDEYQTATAEKAIQVKKEFEAKEIELTVDGIKPDYSIVRIAIARDKIAAFKAKAQAACDATDQAFSADS